MAEPHSVNNSMRSSSVKRLKYDCGERWNQNLQRIMNMNQRRTQAKISLHNVVSPLSASIWSSWESLPVNSWSNGVENGL